MVSGPHARVLISRTQLPKVAYFPRHRSLDQGKTGTCYAHAPVALIESLERKAGLGVLEISRRYAAWAGIQVLNPKYNPDDGGSPTDVLVAMTTRNYGVAPESLCPFTQDRDEIGKEPARAVLEAAAKHVMTHVPMDIGSWAEALSTVGRNVAPVVLASPWPDSWGDPQSMKDGTDGLNAGSGGHAYLFAGYVTLGNETWAVIRNSWGDSVYDSPPADVLALLKTVGMTLANPASGKTDEFLVKLACLAKAHAVSSEKVSAASIDGLNPTLVLLTSPMPADSALACDPRLA